MQIGERSDEAHGRVVEITARQVCSDEKTLWDARDIRELEFRSWFSEFADVRRRESECPETKGIRLATRRGIYSR